jgi:hypothetical protein
MRLTRDLQSVTRPLALILLSTSLTFAQGVVAPAGIYVVNEASNNQPVTSAYASGMLASSAYQNVITGHAIFVPIVQVLPSVTIWGQFNWNWTYVDTLIQTAMSHNKVFSLEFEMGFQNNSGYVNSLPAGWVAACGANCAPQFRTWSTGGTSDQCIEGYVPLPWMSNVQQFWSALAVALAAHLHQTGAYGSLTMIHIPGVSTYDEELRLPSGFPRPASTATQVCPDGTAAFPNVQNDASQARWNSLGYSDSAVVSGFTVIATAFAQAFPDKTLGLSLLNPGATGVVDFPNFTNDAPGTVASQLVKAAGTIAPGRIQIQSDDLDVDAPLPEVIAFANQFNDAIGWQTNKHGGTGAACNSTPCTPDGPNSPFLQLLETGSVNNGRYLEVFSADVAAYPQSFAAAASAKLYPSTAFASAGGFTRVLAHAADGDNFKTEILLTNASPDPAPYSIQFNDERGLRASQGFVLELGSLSGTILPGASATIRTAGEGPNTFQGWAEIFAPAEVGGSVIYSQDTGLPSIQEGTTNYASVQSADFFVPFDNTNNAVTSMALVNPSTVNTPITVTVTLRYLGGTSETLSLPSIPARIHTSFDFRTQFPNSVNRSGVAEFVSSSAIAAVVFSFNSTGAFTSIDPVLAGPAGGTTVRNLAHTADGNGFKTEVLLTNGGPSPAQYTLRLNDTLGNPITSGFQLEAGTLTGTITPGEAATIRTAGLGSETVGGWAQLTAPSSVGGSVIYSQKTTLPSIQQGTSTITGTLSNDFFVPFDNSSGALTSMALTNPGGASATITVVVRYSNGTQETLAFPTLAAGNHTAFIFTSQFPNSMGQMGVAEFQSTVPLSVVAFRFNSTGALTALNAVSQ